jgi:hypothetical protein
MKARLAILSLIAVTLLATCTSFSSVQSDPPPTQETLRELFPTPDPECEQKTRSYLEASSDLMTQWLAARETAQFTPRESLASPIDKLRAIRSAWSNLETPPPTCSSAELTDAKVTMNKHMTGVIDAFSLFMQGEMESVVDAKFGEASEQLDEFSRIMNNVLE